MTTSSEAAFFDAVRPLFGGKLSRAQVDGLKLILNGFEQYGDGRSPSLAYILATAAHETGFTMQPVKETQFTAAVPTDTQVKAKLSRAWKAGKLPWVKKDYWSGGYFGRGFVQLTHAANYDKAGRELGIDLGSNPDLALKPDVAVQILIKGMMEGWFTGKPLGDYITGTEFDFKNARRVVNGTESAEKIKGIAETFLAAIRAAQNVKDTRPSAPAPATPAEPETPATDEPTAEEPEYRGIDFGKVAIAISMVVGLIAVAATFFF